MGCGDSKVQPPPQQQSIPQKKDKKNAKFADDFIDEGQPAENSKEESIQIQGNLGKTKKHHQISPADLKTPKLKAKSQKQNVMKVKKAKELENKPEDDKFINNIMGKSKHKTSGQALAAQPANNPYEKPVIEYSPQRKGDILPPSTTAKKKSQWSKPITSDPFEQGNRLKTDQPFTELNEKEKSPYRVKQIQKRLNDIRNGYEVGDSHEMNFIASNQTIYL